MVTENGVPDPAKRAAALAAGADVVLDNGAADALAQLMEETGGGPNAAIDFVGAPATSGFAVQALAKGATLVLVGLYGGAMPLPNLHVVEILYSNYQCVYELLGLVQFVLLHRRFDL